MLSAGAGATNRFTVGTWRRRLALAEAVAELSHQALSAAQPDDLLRESLRVAIEVVGCDYGTAVRRLPDGQMRVAQESGPSPLPPGALLPLAPDRSYVMHVVETGEAFVSADLRCDRRIAPPTLLLARGVVSGLAVPVRGADQALGVLALHSRRKRRFGRHDVAAARALASVVATAWEQSSQFEKLGRLALHDGLTGLANRALFLDRLDHALARRESAGRSTGAARVAVMLLDLDDFKGINDGYGHAAGDLVLGAVARRLEALVRPEDTVARLGGDEFGVLVDQGPDEPAVLRLAHRLQDACAPPVEADGSLLTVSSSIGITWSGRSPQQRDAAALLGQADAALYRAKDQGRGRIEVFDHRLQRDTRHRRQLESELQAALERDEFRLSYQPVRRSDDLRVLGVEALLRWQHPSRGLLLPDQFVPTAERTGLLVPLGEWVLRTACRQAARWQQDSGTGGDPLWLSVNLSPRQLDHPHLPQTVAEVLSVSGLASGSLALELTESALLAGDGDHRSALAQLRETGIHLFLDDFGTGYSSLTHLTQLPIQAVKIDKSFVAGLPDNRRHVAVVSSLIALSAQLGLEVIAEGVETVEQLRALRLMGCPAVQGFLHDRPTPQPRLHVPAPASGGTPPPPPNRQAVRTQPDH